MAMTEKLRRKSVADFFKSIENFDDSAIYAIDVTNKFRKSVKHTAFRLVLIGIFPCSPH